MSAKILDFVAYRAAHPGSAVRVQVHFAPLWPVQFWIALLRRMGFDWAADLIEALQRDKAELKAEIERLRALLKNKQVTN